MKHFSSIYPSNNIRPSLALKAVYGIGVLLIFINAALMYVDPVSVISNFQQETHSESTTRILDETPLPLHQLTQEINEVKASNCTHPGCNCTPENHCGCLDPSTSESCHTGHGSSNNQDRAHNNSLAQHSNENNTTSICGCIHDSNAQGPATSTNTLSKNWFLEQQNVDFPLKNIFVLSLTDFLKTPLLPDEIFHPPA